MIDSLKNRVKTLREKHGLTQTELARRLDVKPQAIQALEAGAIKKPRFIIPLARELGVTPEYIEGGIESRTASVRQVQVRGVVQAGEWAEAWEWDRDQWYDVPIPADAELSGVQLFAAEVRGPSMNKRYPEGTILVFTDIIETGEQVSMGRRYIVERVRADGCTETTVKILWQEDNGTLWLLPESTDPRFQTPIPLHGSEGETIRIVGRVRYAVSRE